MSFLPPPPPPLPQDVPGAPQRWTVDSQAAKFTIPYLGPEPPPSRGTSIALMVAAGMTAGFYGLRAVTYFWQASIEQGFLDHRTAARAADVKAGTDRLGMFGLVGLLAIGVVILLDLIWRVQRRPKEVRTTAGEAYVEFPLKWVTPGWMRCVWVGCAFVGIFAGGAGSTSATTPLADYPYQRQMTALASLGWMGLWAALAVWVAMVNRSHERRVAWSLPYRADPSQVPFFPAVPGTGIFDISRGPRSGSSGIGWVVRTSGLIFLAFIGVGALIGGIAELGYGHATGFLWTLGGAAALGGVVWVMVRRYQQGRL